MSVSEDAEASGTPPALDDAGHASEPLVRSAFGAANRSRLITRFLEASADPPWKAVYRLLLWADKTTGLAHCYESDKCQPGKNWHVRALRFHDWLSGALAASPAAVGAEIDWLFRHVASDYARFLVSEYQKRLDRATTQREPFAGRGFPEPGDDPGIVAAIREVLGPNMNSEPTPGQWRELTRRIHDLISLENKRKNIVGEGFEDVLGAVVRRADLSNSVEVHARRVLHQVPGFANRKENEKVSKVDLALVRVLDKRRILVTAKWSTRADREEQFKADYNKYVAAESANQTWDYVLVTNEFDPARLLRACTLNAGSNRMLTQVVHICPAALRAVYGANPASSMIEVIAQIESGRIVGLDDWIATLTAEPSVR
jgi:hypothetical protein